MVDIAKLIAVTVLEQGYLLLVAPGALGAVGEDGLHFINKRALGLQIGYFVGLLGNAGNQAVDVIALLVGPQRHFSGIA